MPSHPDSVYTYTEQLPLLGGQAAFLDFAGVLRQAVVIPPNAPAGRLFVQFEVTEQGLVSRPQIIKGPRADLDSVVLKATRQLPRFEPGRHNGQAGPVRLTVPLTF